MKKPALFLFLKTSQLRETAEMAQDWWGEAPDLPLRTSKAAEVVESVVRRAGKPPNRGPARGIRQTVGDGRSNGKPVQLKALDDGGAVGPARQRSDPEHTIGPSMSNSLARCQGVPEPRPTKLRRYGAANAASTAGGKMSMTSPSNRNETAGS